MCVRVPLRNDFLKDKVAIQAKSPTTKRYTQVLDQINAKVSQILTKKNHLSTIPKHSENRYWGPTDESKTHIFLSPFFKYISDES